MKKILVMIIAYNAERHIAKVLDRLPVSLWNNTEYKTEVVVIDDCSKDGTSRVARDYLKTSPHPIQLLRNAINQGYGGNQKVGYTYAIQHGYDAVVMVHGDGQYPPEKIPDMVEPIIRGEADAVFGSRMMIKKDALAGGMPLYKFVGNMVLTRVQNTMLGSNLTEFHTGFRAYSVPALARIPFQSNSNVFHFDTDIIIQYVDMGLSIKEIPIPTHYGDEVCHVNGMRYAFDVMVSTLLSRVQKLGIFYTPKFDYEQAVSYADKSGFTSSHSFALKHVNYGDRVLYIGSDGGVVVPHLEAKGCKVVTAFPDTGNLVGQHFDVILVLDIIENLPSPEQFLSALHDWCAADNSRIVITTPNIAFFIQRFMLLFGQFNYSKRGILDMKHMRLFTFSSCRQLIANAGLNLISIEGVPAPFPLAFGNNKFGQFLLKCNERLIGLWKAFFAYQIAVVAKPRPTLDLLVKAAIAEGQQVK